ncbi:MAG: hypothetical protein KKC03_14025 [Bacteroidetes bacterium]|nr:hypothetical protein [Bacteroidota bacterium]
MTKQASTIVIYRRSNGYYYCDAHGCFGGGYSGAFAGIAPEAAAIFAAREKGRYIDTNPTGGSMILPREVRSALAEITS